MMMIMFFIIKLNNENKKTNINDNKTKMKYTYKRVKVEVNNVNKSMRYALIDIIIENHIRFVPEKRKEKQICSTVSVPNFIWIHNHIPFHFISFNKFLSFTVPSTNGFII